jgi:transposase
MGNATRRPSRSWPGPGTAPNWPTCGKRSRRRFTEHHAFLLSRRLGWIDTIDADIATVEDRIEDLVALFAAAVTRLGEIPGVGVAAARARATQDGMTT